jgi:hypothetical protein
MLADSPLSIPSYSPTAAEIDLRSDAVNGVLEALHTFFHCPLGRIREPEAPAARREVRRKR